MNNIDLKKELKYIAVYLDCDTDKLIREVMPLIINELEHIKDLPSHVMYGSLLNRISELNRGL